MTKRKSSARETVRVERPVVDEEKLNAHPATRKRLEAIQDPLERYLEASRVAHPCYHRHDQMIILRQRRRIAVVALFRFHIPNKAEIARRIGAKDRRVVDSAFTVLDLRDIPQEFQDSEELALREAKRVHRTYVRREAIGETAREIRRMLIWELTETEMHGKKYTSASLAEMSGRTTALIAQNRTGSSNRTKPALRAAAKLRKEQEAAAA